MEKTTVLRGQCPFCGVSWGITVSVEQYGKWQAGAYIQDVMSNLTVDEREMLISGICGKCFDALYAAE